MRIQDGELVDRALGGSEHAYREIVLRYQRPLLTLISRMVRDRALAEDLAQEVFLKAFRRLDTYDRRRRFSSWLFKIAHNTAIDYLRRREPPSVPLQPGEGEESGMLDLLPDRSAEAPDRAAQRRDLARCLNLAVERLRPEYREVVLLRFQEGLPYEEIAEITGLPLGTVKTHLHRARKELAVALREMGWVPE